MKMQISIFKGHWPMLIVLLVGATSVQGEQAKAVEQKTNVSAKASSTKPLAAVLSPEKWQQLEKSVDRALIWMASRQAADGSFETLPSGQPAITSLATMAFLSRGHLPGQGPYGQRMNRAIDYVVSCQMSNGLITLMPPGPQHQDKQPSHNAIYNHAISALMLGEVYGQVSGTRAKAVKQAIEQALRFSHQHQHRSKAAVDVGGWRYIRINPWGSNADSDLSVTGWHMMFLRSAKNGEFDVLQSDVDEAVAYVRRLWNPDSGAFSYDSQNLEATSDKPVNHSRGMVGAGILCLSLGGQHDSPMARAAGDWLLAHPVKSFGNLATTGDRFFYGTYYSSQAMVQLGGRYWEKYFPPLVDALLSGQAADGSWPPEIRSSVKVIGAGSEAMFGNVYSSALAVLSLTPPYQLLPIYQR